MLLAAGVRTELCDRPSFNARHLPVLTFTCTLEIVLVSQDTSSRIWHLAVVTRLERVEDDSDYTKNVQRYWKGAVRDSRRRPCPSKPFQLALGQRGKVWPTPSYHESHRKTNTDRSCWVSGFKSRPNRIAYG